MKDQLIFEAAGRLFGFETDHIHKVLETERVYFLPGQSGAVTGIVTLSGEPVTVLDTFSLLSVAPPVTAEQKSTDAEFHRIIVVTDGERLLGFDIGASEISFVWNERPEEAESAERPNEPEEAEKTDVQRLVTTEHEVKEKIDINGRSIESIDWLPYFDIATDILSTERANG